MLFYHTSSVHTLGMRFAIDVAFCKEADSGDLVVTATTTMKPWCLGYPRFASSVVLEAEAGSFARWGLLPGDQLQVVHQPTATSAARQATADLHAAPFAAADGSRALERSRPGARVRAQDRSGCVYAPRPTRRAPPDRSG